MLRTAALLCAAVGLRGDDVGPAVWPQPFNMTWGTAVYPVDSTHFKFTLASRPTEDASPLTAAFARFEASMFPHRAGEQGEGGVPLASALVTVGDPDAAVDFGVDESYTLTVDERGVAIAAATQVGVYRAMETLRQLVVFNFTTEGYVVKNGPVRVADAPRFPHREVMVDTARHFQPVASLLRVVDSLAAAKFNVLHWHLSDAESFPYKAPSLPRLAAGGAYSPSEQYTQHDLEDVVGYARARGIRVIVEFDTPGHAASWCQGMPELCPSAACTSPLRPNNEATFDTYRTLLRDATRAATDGFVHIGGDEADTTCWEKTADIKAWMAGKNFTATEAYNYFTGRVMGVVAELGKTAVAWEEVYTAVGKKLPKDVVVVQWRSQSTICENATADGYRCLRQQDHEWYLDKLGVKWGRMYRVEPCASLSDAQCKLMLGGGGAMWGETVDASDILNTIWPRAAAVAERLWSPRYVADVDAATPRLAAFRCYLTRLGVPAAPIDGDGRAPPLEPGSCFAQ
eukprot:TRINITY_DN19696_c0_g1_i1.p1 TRINITY_DN19696_c0_g1~~TRINITY_DN19696_c0_g1_i1.p1  ORF type:complete len:514 (+),score=173.67 TRINITY_DN19696_c0_g1_i1:56-1597(+)